MANRNQIEIMDGKEELYPLMDRLQACSHINHPNRLWSREFYYECAWRWRDKIDLLKERVLKLEKKLKNNS